MTMTRYNKARFPYEGRDLGENGRLQTAKA
jgi:hypothetical protein